MTPDPATAAERTSLAWPLRLLLAPATWLERSRGIGRLALGLTYALIFSAAGLLLWRASTLNGLPAIGEPAGLGPLRRLELPDNRNAFVLWARASARLEQYPMTEGDLAAIVESSWDELRAALDPWLDRHRRALEIWREGTERPDALNPYFWDVRDPTGPTIVRDQRSFALLGLLMAGRLDQSGDREAAWTWYRAVLRSSRHVGTHGGWESRLVGIEIHEAGCSLARRWATQPDVSSDLLRRAIRDVQALDNMTPTNSETFMWDYLDLDARLAAVDRGELTLPGSDAAAAETPETLRDRRIRRFLAHEPERSRRVLRLIFANWLAECDRLPRDRPVSVTSSPDLFADPKAGPWAGAIGPKSLQQWLATCELAKLKLPDFGACDATFQERATRARLILHLAEQAYQRDRKQAPSSPDDLIGLYLDHLPPGLDAASP
jgi:hypothetical protein